MIGRGDAHFASEGGRDERSPSTEKIGNGPPVNDHARRRPRDLWIPDASLC